MSGTLGSSESRSARLQGSGHIKDSNRRGAVPLHGGSVQPEPGVCTGVDGGDYSDNRASLRLPRKTDLEIFPKSIQNSVIPAAASKRERSGGTCFPFVELLCRAGFLE